MHSSPRDQIRAEWGVDLQLLCGAPNPAVITVSLGSDGFRAPLNHVTVILRLACASARVHDAHLPVLQ